MKPSDVTDAMLKRMSPQERAKLDPRIQTTEEAAAKFIARSEKELQDKIAEYLNLKGIAFMRQRMDKRTTGTLGWPDFTFCILRVLARPVAIEVKHEARTLDPDQRKCIRKMLSNGWCVFVVRDLEHAAAIIRGEHSHRTTNITAEELETE